MPDLINIGDMRGLLLSLDDRIVLPPGRVFDHQRKRIKTLGKQNEASGETVLRFTLSPSHDKVIVNLDHYPNNW